MRKMIYVGALVALSGCAQLPAWLQANGVSAGTAAKVNTVMSDAVADGSLFCAVAGVVAAVPGVNVTHATAQSVAAACAAAQVIGAAIQTAAATIPYPVPPPMAPAAVPIAVVPPAVAAAVVASVKS